MHLRSHTPQLEMATEFLALALFLRSCLHSSMDPNLVDTAPLQKGLRQEDFDILSMPFQCLLLYLMPIGNLSQLTSRTVSKKAAGKKPFAFNAVPFPQKKPGVDVGHDVWIGSGVSINRGIKIGDGAVVAANSVVTKDVAPYSIVGGNPAKHIKFRFEQEICEGLQRIRWWEFELSDLHELPLSDPYKFIEQFEKNKNNIRPYKPLKSKFWDLIKQHSDRS